MIALRFVCLPLRRSYQATCMRTSKFYIKTFVHYFKSEHFNNLKFDREIYTKGILK